MLNRRVFLASTAAAALATSRAGAQSLTPVRLGVSTAETYAEGFYANEQKFLERAGIAAEISMLSNGAALVAAVAGGSLDIAPANVIALSSAHLRGLPIVVLTAGALYNNSRTTHALVVANDSPLRSARDMAGKTVAIVGLRSLEELAVRSWIDNNGGDSTKISFVEMPNSAEVPALLSHHIDAAMMPEPWVTDAKNDTRILAKPMDSIAKHFVITAWFTTQAWLDANRATAQRFVTAMNQTAAWSNANPKPSGVILAKALKLPQTTVDSMARLQMAESNSPDLYQPVIDSGLKYGLLAKGFPAREMLAGRA